MSGNKRMDYENIVRQKITSEAKQKLLNKKRKPNC